MISMTSRAGVALKSLILFLAAVCVFYVGGFLLLHYTGLLDLAKSSSHPQTDTWLYRLYKPLEDRWPW
jgi:hypothetical protein